jgi:hypothetical protein
MTFHKSPLNKITKPLRYILGALRIKVNPKVKGLIHEVFIGIKGMKQSHILINFTFPVDFPILPSTVIRTGNIIYQRMNDLIGGHMGKIPAGKGKFV